MNELGKRLRARRAALGLKQDELAARLFVTRQTISNYERGLSEPDLDMLRRLAEALETEPAVLLGSETAARKGSGKKELLSFLLGLVLTAGVAALFIVLEKQAFAWKGTHYDIVPYERVVLLLMPLIFLLLGWTLAQGADCLTPLPTLPRGLRIGIRVAVISAIVLYLLALAPMLLRLPLEERFRLDVELAFSRAAHLGTGWGRHLALLFGAALRLSRKNKDLTQGQDMV